ncbi:MAG: polysaccharide deacetylase family protein [Chitinophagales bacterium]
MTKHTWVNIAFLLAVVMMLICSVTWYWWVLMCFFYTAVIFLGSYFIQLNFFIHSFNKSALNEKKIALTFDDGPNEATPQLLDFLKQENIPATFFLIGKNIAGKEALLQRMLNENHLIGNHSYEHGFWFSMQSPSKVVAEMNACNRQIQAFTGKRPLFFRPPYGVTNPWVASGISECKMYSIGWSLRSYDTVSKSPQALARSVIKKLKSGDVLLFHDAATHTIQALPEIIAYLRQQQISVVPLNELLQLQPYDS